MPSVSSKNNENFEQMLRRFKKACDRDKVIQDYKKHEFYVKPSKKKKEDKEQSLKRQKRLARKKNSKKSLY